MLQVVGITMMIVGMTITISYISHKMSRSRLKLFVLLVFICYICGNFYFTLTSRESGEGILIDLIPFQSYRQLFIEPGNGPSAVAGFANIMLYGLTPFEGIVLNVLLYYPLGYLLPILFPKLRIGHIILIGFIISVGTELSQLIFKLGCCETDDVIHNTLGTVTGVTVWHLQITRSRGNNTI